jgi:hypothetical protein
MKAAVCQSCGMPMQRDSDFGTKSNGSRSREYCRFCFRDGSFSDEGISMKEKIRKNIEIAKKMGMPEGKARELAQSTIPRLKRWRKG